MEFNLHNFIIFKLKMNNFEIDDINGYDDMMIRIDYNKIKASMISKIDEYLSSGIDSVCQPMNQLIIKSEPTRKISLDEYRRRQQIKLCNFSENEPIQQKLDDSSVKSNSLKVDEQQNKLNNNQLISQTPEEQQKEKNKIKCKKFRCQQRLKNLKPERSKPLSTAEKCKRYRERKARLI